MKSLPCVLFVLSAVSLSANASDVKPGDAMIDVRRNLGAPRGAVHVGDREIFYYDRGEIEARAGVVTRSSLRSEEEQTELDAKRSLEATRLREAREIRQAQLLAEGESLKARKLTDPSFRTLPMSYQVAFWEDFSRRYPNVASAEPLAEARARLAAETEEKRKQLEQAQRIAELEARVAANERNAQLDRMIDQERYGAMRGYPPFVSYSRYHGLRDYWPRSEPVKGVIRMYEFPLPYATSPGMPPVSPVYRKDAFDFAGESCDSLRNVTEGNRSYWSPPSRRF